MGVFIFFILVIIAIIIIINKHADNKSDKQKSNIVLDNNNKSTDTVYKKTNYNIDEPVNCAIKHIEEAYFDIIQKYFSEYPKCSIELEKEKEYSDQIVFAITVGQYSSSFWCNGMEELPGWQKVYNTDGSLNYNKIKKVESMTMPKDAWYQFHYEVYKKIKEKYPLWTCRIHPMSHELDLGIGLDQWW